MFISDAFIWHMQRKSRRIHRLCSQKQFRYPGSSIHTETHQIEIAFICCGGQFRKQMYSICRCFQDYYYVRRRKNVLSVAVLTRDPEARPRTASKQEEERIRCQADCQLLFKWKEVKRILKENIFSQGSVLLHFLSSFRITRIAVSFFGKKYRIIWLAQLPTFYCSLFSGCLGMLYRIFRNHRATCVFK